MNGAWENAMILPKAGLELLELMGFGVTRDLTSTFSEKIDIN